MASNDESDWDPLLLPLRRARTEAEAEQAINSLLTDIVVPKVMQFCRNKLSHMKADARRAMEADLLADVVTGVSRRLDGLWQQTSKTARGEFEPIRNFKGYVSGTANRTLFSLLRRQNGPWRRLCDRLRDLFAGKTLHKQFVEWRNDNGQDLVGFLEWHGKPHQATTQYEQLLENPGILQTLNILPADAAQLPLHQLVQEVLKYVKIPVPKKNLIWIIAVLVEVPTNRALQERSLSELTDEYEEDVMDRLASKDQTREETQNPLDLLLSKEKLEWFWASIRKDPPHRLFHRRPVLLQRGSPLIDLLLHHHIARISQIATTLEDEPRWLTQIISKAPSATDDKNTATDGLLTDQEICERYDSYSDVNHVAQCRFQARRNLAKQYRCDFRVDP